MHITRFAMVLLGEGGDDDDKPLKHFNFKTATTCSFR
jgi:hypothetical protein